MAIQKVSYCSIFLLVLLCSVTSMNGQVCTPPCTVFPPFHCNNPAVFNRRNFKPGFIFGAATSAYQVEGAAGRAMNSWDLFTHRYPEKTADGSNGDIADDSFRLFRADVALLKQMNADAYRFSIAWSRILPRGRLSGGINEGGITYYNSLINELKANGIEPFVTIFHWDVPLTLEDAYGGFLSPLIANDYRDFAELCFQRFGDRVKYWITLNQPYTTSIKGYGDGTYAPGRCSSCNAGNSAVEPYIVAKNQLLAHAEAVALYRRKYKRIQGGMIGITLIGRWFIPYNAASIADRFAVQRALDFFFGWFMDPLATGDYPMIMKKLVGSRLPAFTPNQSALVRGSFDFIGLNYYVSQYASDAPPPDPARPSAITDPRVNLTYFRDGVAIGPQGFNFVYYPPGFRELLAYIKNRYNNPLIYITENGFKDNGRLPLAATLTDQGRIEYHCSHLSCLRCAIQNGSNVAGYIAWSLMDNFEFGEGYTVRFGLNYVNFSNVTDRRPKLSGRWFSDFLRRT